MSVSLTNVSTKDADDATAKSKKKDFVFGYLAGGSLAVAEGAAATVGGNEELLVGVVDTLADTAAAETMIDHMISNANAATTQTVAADAYTAMEDIIDDYFGGSFSEAMDVIMESRANTTAAGSNATDLAADLAAFAAAQDAGDEAVETTASINTTASLGVAMSAMTVGLLLQVDQLILVAEVCLPELCLYQTAC